MKIQKETALFEVAYGSHLFGTATPKSDYDYKVVCLPSFEDLLMNKRLTNRQEKPEGKLKGEKMLAEEEEYEYIPLQVFLDQFFEGQTYALEVAFAVLSDMHVTLEYDFGELSIAADSIRIQEWMTELVSRFLTRNVQKMVSYAVSQSRQYGLKTERYNALLQARELFNRYAADDKPGELPLLSRPMKNNPELLEEMLKIPYVKRTTVMNGDGGTTEVPGLEVAGKKFPENFKWRTIIESINSSIQTYGNRVKDHTGEPTDWKALSHAIRIGEEVIDLLDTGRIEFPRPNAAYLVDVKKGNVPLEQATEYLTTLFNKIDTAMASSELPERDEKLEAEFYEFKLDLLKSYYRV